MRGCEIAFRGQTPFPLENEAGKFAPQNGSRLDDLAEIEAQNFCFALKFNRRTEINQALTFPHCQTDFIGSLLF